MRFHVEHGLDPVDRVLKWLDLELSPGVRAQLDQYAAWLESEGMEAGGLGPGESNRILGRHIADSLAFAGGFGVPLPSPVVDVGSGVGLPGIPLAITFSDVQVVLLDRSGRRARLLQRVIRVLGLENTEVVESDVDSFDRRVRGVTFRASLRPQAAMAAARRLLESSGVAVFGLSRTVAPNEAELAATATSMGLSARVVRVPPQVLDSPAWLLRMTPQ